MTIKVKATRRGYYGGRVYLAGEEFAVTAKADVGSWMTPITEEIKAPKSQKGGGKKDESSETESDELA